ncbi:microcin C transport system substrate-binding protein [Atopomonas hussainii]|uniref:Microcin C transport system substrate-binding protein n=1 Tax=Atopomonas hussainii TaxID=1429083 RepID=A0A1H7PPX1_9GAMM|nr:extracellular solute-binding protein [Atopomonas hussainii]SEL37813.1 microcin C transport system substrate-binding protein [Atopomonas hussainii]
MLRLFTFLLTSLACSPLVLGGVTESHGYTQFGSLKYPANFTHFDWVNPDAPKGGTLRIMGNGTFDTLNPYSLKGTSPIGTPNFIQYGITELNEPLMVGNGFYDPNGEEPSTAYGLIAKSVEYSDDRSWAVFNLRPEARFHDGKPITAYDVAFSYRLLLKEGHPQYRTYLQEVARVDILDRHRIRFVLKRSGNPQLILQLAELPVLPQHYWKNRDFRATTFEPPLGSGPYKITEVVPGRRLTFERVRNWWGEKLPVNRGKYNVNRMTVEFYRDSHVAFEAFKAGEFDVYIEHQAKNWANGYNFPALHRGAVLKEEIAHQIPTQTQGFFFNTRRPVFADVRVRKALSLLFDFEWTNRTLFNSSYKRSRSYYPNSQFRADGLPSGEEWLLLKPFRKQLPAELFTQPIEIPETAGHGIPRDTLREVLALLNEAGYRHRGGAMVNADGQPLRFEMLLVNPNFERILQPYRENLARVGIITELRTVDRSQYKQRLDGYDFDMILMTLSQSLSPSLEQLQYFHSGQANVRGARNYAGVRSPIIDALLDQLINAKTRERQVGAARAIDRVLMHEHYMIPNWYIDYHRVAYWNRFEKGATPPYTLGLRAWWLKPEYRL